MVLWAKKKLTEITFLECPRCNSRIYQPNGDPDAVPSEEDLKLHKIEPLGRWTLDLAFVAGIGYPVCPVCYNKWLLENIPILNSNKVDLP